MNRLASTDRAPKTEILPRQPAKASSSLGAQRAAARMAAIDELALQAAGFAAMDYDFLFDKVRRQLVIGYNVAQLRVDEGRYDLLASEATTVQFRRHRARKLPQESWLRSGAC